MSRLFNFECTNLLTSKNTNTNTRSAIRTIQTGLRACTSSVLRSKQHTLQTAYTSRTEQTLSLILQRVADRIATPYPPTTLSSDNPTVQYKPNAYLLVGSSEQDSLDLLEFVRRNVFLQAMFQTFKLRAAAHVCARLLTNWKKSVCVRSRLDFGACVLCGAFECNVAEQVNVKLIVSRMYVVRRNSHICMCMLTICVY